MNLTRWYIRIQLNAVARSLHAQAFGKSNNTGKCEVLSDIRSSFTWCRKLRLMHFSKTSSTLSSTVHSMHPANSFFLGIHCFMLIGACSRSREYTLVSWDGSPQMIPTRNETFWCFAARKATLSENISKCKLSANCLKGVFYGLHSPNNIKFKPPLVQVLVCLLSWRKMHTSPFKLRKDFWGDAHRKSILRDNLL